MDDLFKLRGYSNVFLLLKMVKIYEDYMAKVAVLLGANPKIAKLHMKQVMEFETNLAHVRTWMYYKWYSHSKEEINIHLVSLSSQHFCPIQLQSSPSQSQRLLSMHCNRSHQCAVY